MKRKILFFVIVMVFVMSGCGKNHAEKIKEDVLSKPDCVSSVHSSEGDYQLTIIANENEITDKKAYARMLIEKVQKNDFKTIMFSYDMTEYPTRLQMSVYLSEEDWKDKDVEPYMEVSFEQEDFLNGYNIVDDYDKFTLKID